MSTHVGDIFFDAKVDRKQYDKDMSSLEKGAGAIGSKIGKKLSMAIGGAIATMGIGQLINKVGTLGDTVDKMSQKLGMSNKAYQEWDYIMQRCGANIDSMTVAMKTLASSVMTSKDALKELGISQEEALGMSQQELFSRVITALQGIEDKTRRTYLAGQLLGRGATELGAVLNLTQQDMENMRSRVANLGGVMSDLAVKNSAMFKDSLLDIRMAFKGIANSIAEYVLPIITSAVNRVIIPALLRIAQAVRLVFGFISRLVGGIRSTFGKVGGAFKSAFGKGTQKDMNSSAKSIGNVGSGLGKAGGNANKAKKAVQALKRELFGFDRITKLTKQDASTGTSGAGGAGGGGGGLGDLGGIGDVEGYEQASNFFSGLEELEIPPALSESLDNLKRAFSGLFDVLGEFGQWALDEILIPLGQWALNDGIPAGLDVLAGAIDVITEALKLLGTILKPIWDSLLKPFFDWWLGFQADKMQTVASVLTKLAEAIAKIREKIEGWKEKSAEIKVTLTDKLTSAWNKVKGVWDKVKSKTATVSLKLSNGFSTAWSKVKRRGRASNQRQLLSNSSLPKPSRQSGTL